MVYHRLLNIAPCAVQQDLVVYPFSVWKLPLLTPPSHSVSPPPPPPWQPPGCCLCPWFCFCWNLFNTRSIRWCLSVLVVGEGELICSSQGHGCVTISLNTQEKVLEPGLVIEIAMGVLTPGRGLWTRVHRLSFVLAGATRCVSTAFPRTPTPANHQVMGQTSETTLRALDPWPTWGERGAWGIRDDEGSWGAGQGNKVGSLFGEGSPFRVHSSLE